MAWQSIDYDPFAEDEKEVKRKAGEGAVIPGIGIDLAKEGAFSESDLRGPQPEFPELPMSSQYDPFQAFNIQTIKEPNYGILGKSWGILTPQEQQADLESRFADYERGQTRIQNLERALGATSDPYKKQAIQLQIDAFKQGLPDIETLTKMRAGELPLATKTPLRSGVERAVGGFANTVIDNVKMFGILNGYLKPGSVDKDTVLKLSRSAQQYVNDQFPGDPVRQNDFSQHLAYGLGQIALFYGAGAATALAKAGPKVAFAVIAALGANTTGAQGFEEATQELQAAKDRAALSGDQASVTELDRLLKTLGYMAIGTTEAVPIARTLSRVVPTPKTALGSRFLQAAEGGLEEAAQESGSQVAQNLATQYTTDPNRPTSEGVAESGAVGGALGFALNALLPGAGRAFRQNRPQEGEGAFSGEPETPLLPGPEFPGEIDRGTLETVEPGTRTESAAPRQLPGAQRLLPAPSSGARLQLRDEVERQIRANPSLAGQAQSWLDIFDSAPGAQPAIDQSVQTLGETGQLSFIANQLIPRLQESASGLTAQEVFQAPTLAGRVRLPPPGEATRLGTEQTDPFADVEMAPLEPIEPQFAVGPEVTPSDLDPLGLYSKALRDAQAIPQERGTPEQMLAQLIRSGTKEAEIRATNLDQFLYGEAIAGLRRGLIDLQARANALQNELRNKQREITPERRAAAEAELAQIQGRILEADQAFQAALGSSNLPRSFTRQQIVGYLDDNRTNLQETIRSAEIPANVQQAYDRLNQLNSYLQQSGADVAPYQEEISQLRDTVNNFEATQRQPKWKTFSLDPDNPTYRETTVHLPPDKGELKTWTIISSGGIPRATYAAEEMARDQLRPGETIREDKSKILEGGFRDGHFPEKNIVVHHRSQELQTTDGRRVMNLDELQSSWGQKVREGGARDEAKIAELENRLDTLRSQIESSRQAALDAAAKLDFLGFDTSGQMFGAIQRDSKWREHWSIETEEDNIYADRLDAYVGLKNARDLTNVELITEKASVPAHPLVRSTDQWVLVGLRNFLRHAAESDVDGVTITPGKVQTERYSLGRVLESIDVQLLSGGERTISIFGINGRMLGTATVDKNGIVTSATGFAGDVASQMRGRPLSDTIGQRGQEAVMATTQPQQTVSLEDVQVGGEGMRATYDQIYPRAMAKLLQKLDKSIKPEKVRVVPHDADPGDDLRGFPEGQPFQNDFTYFPLTDKAKIALLSEGQPIFAVGSEPESGAVVEFQRSGKAGRLEVLDRQIDDLSSRIDEANYEIEDILDAGRPSKSDEARLSQLYETIDNLHGTLGTLNLERESLRFEKMAAQEESGLTDRRLDAIARQRSLQNQRYALEDEFQNLTEFSQANPDNFIFRRNLQLTEDQLQSLLQMEEDVQFEIESIEEALDNIRFAKTGELSDRQTIQIVKLGGDALQNWQSALEAHFLDRGEPWLGAEAATEAIATMIATQSETSAEMQKALNAEGFGSVPDELLDQGVLVVKLLSAGETQIGPSALKGFYSPALRAVERAKQDRATPEQWKKLLQGPGIRQEEIKWMGLDAWLDDQAAMAQERPGSNAPKKARTIPKEELIDFISSNEYELDEKVFGNLRTPSDEGEARNVEFYQQEYEEWVNERAIEIFRELRDAIVEDQMAEWLAANDPDNFKYEVLSNLDELTERPIYEQAVKEYRGATQAWIDQLTLPGFEPGNYPKVSDFYPEGFTDQLIDNQTGFYFYIDKPSGAEDGDYDGADGGEYFATEDEAREAAEAYIKDQRAGFERAKQVQQELLYEQDFEREWAEANTISRRYAIPGGEDYSELVINAADLKKAGYSSTHFGENEIVHVRYDMRRGPNGERILFIHEIQSDLHQNARKRGYRKKNDRALALQAAEKYNTMKEAYLQPILDKLVAGESYSVEIDGDILTYAIEEIPPYDPKYGAVGYQGILETIRGKGAITNVHPNKDKAAFQMTPNLSGLVILKSVNPELYRARNEAERLEHIANSPYPDAPYKANAWWKLGFKVALKKAAELDMDAVALATPEQISNATSMPKHAAKKFYGENLPRFIDKYMKQWGSGREDRAVSGTSGSKQPYWPLSKKMLADLLDPDIGQPQAALHPDMQGRMAALAHLKMGRKFEVPNLVVETALDALARNRDILPSNVGVGVLKDVRPVEGVPEDVVVKFQMDDGRPFLFRFPKQIFKTSRAFFLSDPSGRGAVSPRVLFIRFSLSGQIEQSFRGELAHEGLHAINSFGLIPKPVWRQFFNHAMKLRILSMPLNDYMKFIGRESSDNPRNNRPLEEVYHELYKDIDPATYRRYMEEEAVAHMNELYVYGVLESEDVAPVKDLLDALNNGEFKKQSEIYGRKTPQVARKIAQLMDQAPEPRPALDARLPIRDVFDRRILRHEAATLRSDGSVFTGRPSRQGDLARPVSRDAAAAQRPGRAEAFSIPDFAGYVTAQPPKPGYIARLTYDLYPSGTDIAEAGERRKIAHADINQHPDGAWEVHFINVSPFRLKRGIATKLYGAIERDLGIRISPSGLMTPDGYAFWKKRSPESVKWHRYSRIDGMYDSPRRLKQRLRQVDASIRKRQALQNPSPQDQNDLVADLQERAEIQGLLYSLPKEARSRDIQETMFALSAGESQTDTPEFKRWFGNSKVVDENGQPLVVYHGTEKAGFNRFDRKYENTSSGTDASGFYFTSHKLGAETYSGTREEALISDVDRGYDPFGGEPGNYAVYLSIQEPLIVDFEGNGWDDAPEDSGFGGQDINAIAEFAETAGYDGVIAKNINDEGPFGQGYGWGDTTYVVFQPTQIKSIFNRGTYDPLDPRISYAYGGEAAEMADLSALEQAKSMLAEGKTPEEIRAETGWFQGLDEKWRFEIDDSKARILPSIKELKKAKEMQLAELLEHEGLYQQYPMLAQLPVFIKQDRPYDSAMFRKFPEPSNALARGATRLLGDVDHMEIGTKGLESPEQMQTILEIVLHEITHYIQSQERFNVGANYSGQLRSAINRIFENKFTDLDKKIMDSDSRIKSKLVEFVIANNKFAEDIDNPYNVELFKQTARSLGEHLGWAYYQRSAGEAEARNVERRQSLSPAERRAIPPNLTDDLPREQMVVKYNIDQLVDALRARPNPEQIKSAIGNRGTFDPGNLDILFAVGSEVEEKDTERYTKYLLEAQKKGETPKSFAKFTGKQ